MARVGVELLNNTLPQAETEWMMPLLKMGLSGPSLSSGETFGQRKGCSFVL